LKLNFERKHENRYCKYLRRLLFLFFVNKTNMGLEMRKTFVGVLFGVLFGVIDVIPMIIQNLSWEANLSAFFHWVSVGFFIATVNLNLKASVKGILIAVISLIPIAFIVWTSDVSAIIPMSVSTLVFGALLGYLIEKFGNKNKVHSQ